MQEQLVSPPSIGDDEIEKALIIEAIAKSEVGISFLRLLCKWTGWSRSTCTNEESARRDLWIVIRKYVPVETLPQIEYEDLKQQQKQIRELLKNLDTIAKSQELAQ
ncbi:MAG: hypothetical protein KGI50_06045 [Patescibacteria group bacterium]|nr:hypothetical protein [Patescibacteria group bacterium]